MLARPFVKIICGLGLRDPGLVRRICSLYTLAGADVLDVALDLEVVRAAVAGIGEGIERGAGRAPPLLMVSTGLEADPHVGAALLHRSLCAGCDGCVIEGLRACAERPLHERAPECPDCLACAGACPRGALRFAPVVEDRAVAVRSARRAGAGALELHVAGAALVELEALWREVEPACDGMMVSLSVGAVVEGPAAVGDKARWARAVGREVILQVEGRPMSGDRAPRSDAATIAAAVALREAGLGAVVQLAGGTGAETMKRALRAGARPDGIAFGTAARLAVSDGLYSRQEPGDPAREKALEAARALVRSVRGLADRWRGPG